MTLDLQLKKGDTRDWVFTLSDSSGSALNLTSATVAFQLRLCEGDDNTFFVRNSVGTGSDFISIDTPASDGQVTITPTSSDWDDVSDWYGVYTGEFKVTDSNSRVQYTTDVLVDVQEAVI